MLKELSQKYLTVTKVIFLSVIIGAVGGVVGALFSHSVEFVTELRAQYNWLLYLLPLVGIITVAVYKLLKLKGVSTNRVLESVRSEINVPARLAPAIFFCTVLTHLSGGSAGREGAALQIGGSISAFLSKRFKLDTNARQTVIQYGMASLFSALFGTPVAAAVFALEVICIGRIRLFSVLPCAVSSGVAYFIAHLLNVTAERFTYDTIPEISAYVLLKVAITAVLSSLICLLFCYLLQITEHYSEKWFKNDFVRTLICGTAVVAISILLKTTDYNGGGVHVISRIFTDGEFRYEAFAIKILVTCLTVAGGYKGGEIIPSLFIGATFGALCGEIIGLDIAFSAAIGAVSVFCGVTNCLMASIIISVELFSIKGVGYYALCCFISFVLTNKIGIFKQDRISFSDFLTSFNVHRNQ